jgi:V/A-type H+-transporting ATPase subunit E
LFFFDFPENLSLKKKLHLWPEYKGIIKNTVFDMDTKIQELTGKIYREGVEKGKAEAERIITEAKIKGAALLDEARAEAGRILAEAEKQAAELRKNTEAELKMYATRSVEALKSEVTNLITGKVVSGSVKTAISDAEFMKKVILEIAREWAKNGAVSIQTSDAAALTAYFESNAKELLNKGVKVEQINGKPASFLIAPADGAYKVSFGEEEFTAYFKDFLRPQLIEILF